MSFYRLSFASQMIVWAMRKRLHLLRNGVEAVDVAHVFGLGGLAGTHAALSSVVDVLLCSVASRIDLHAVSCPCLAPHEVVLLGALAALQDGDERAAEVRIGALLCRPATELVLPALKAIVLELDAKDLELTPMADETPTVLPASYAATLH